MKQLLMATANPGSSKSIETVSQEDGGVYEIKVKGLLDYRWKGWFEGMTLKHEGIGETCLACTIITGPVADQPALHGLLAKIRDLNLTLISVSKIGITSSDNQEGDPNMKG